MRACAGFVLGAFGTSVLACPPGSSGIVSEADCASAARAFGKPYFSETNGNYPGGCMSDGRNIVFNFVPGYSNIDSHYQPLCAGAP